ncbi:Pho80p cyclin [Sporothrix epigloea]|uniref:Pho80p cyclin n=1 Tax=Sporothrix epigloea TaxID=1892477 RepID=A0ABP0D4Z1_9PEZI
MKSGTELGVNHAVTDDSSTSHFNDPTTQANHPTPGARVDAASSSSVFTPAPESTAPLTLVPSTAGAASSSLSSDRSAFTSSIPHPASKASPSAQSQQPYSTSPNKRRISQQGLPSQHNDANVESEPSAGPDRHLSPPVADTAPGASKRAKPEAAPVKTLPEQYEFCKVEDMVVLIANMLGELIETNDVLALKSGHLTRFHSRTPPGISVLDYLNRLAKHATLTPPLLLSMVYYIDRLCAMYSDFTINTLTVHRFLITAATVAAKGLSDSFWNNTTYARVGGVRVAELKMLELEFLYRLEWKIVPNPEVLAAYYRPLVERCPGYALPPDRSPSRDEEEMSTGSDSNVGRDTVKVNPDAADNGSAKSAYHGHQRQSSTTLIGEDMVHSGLTRQPTR